MNERLLQYIWQFGYFNRSHLKTIQGDPVDIIYTGQHNTNQGADFLEAVIRIGDMKWSGNIELHIKTSDWEKHEHCNDPNFSNIILHVVWEHDRPVKDRETMPTLVLQPHVPGILINRYEQLMNRPATIACAANIAQVNRLVRFSWYDTLLLRRLQRKSEYIMQLFEASRHHWDEVCWWMIARNLGIKINADFFEAIAKTIPVNILAKHKNQVQQLEALLLGQAGLLPDPVPESDSYMQLLQREFTFLNNKYRLSAPIGNVKFLRMRPGSFPTVRLAQLAMLIHQSSHLFACIKETTDLNKMMKMLDVTANDYWHYHYIPGIATAYKPKVLGKEMINNIIINTIVPLLFAYGSYTKQDIYKERGLQWLEELEGEVNNITRQFEETGIKVSNSVVSQALIELNNEYCTKKMCLNCAIGNAILKQQ